MTPATVDGTKRRAQIRQRALALCCSPGNVRKACTPLAGLQAHASTTKLNPQPKHTCTSSAPACGLRERRPRRLPARHAVAAETPILQLTPQFWRGPTSACPPTPQRCLATQRRRSSLEAESCCHGHVWPQPCFALRMPTDPPAPLKHCRTCESTQPHRSHALRSDQMIKAACASACSSAAATAATQQLALQLCLLTCATTPRRTPPASMLRGSVVSLASRRPTRAGMR